MEEIEVNIKDSLKSQYQASLEMLRQAIVKCPNSMWDDREYKNVFWLVSYHALFYTHLYLQPSKTDLIPWSKHIQGRRDLGNKPIGEPYSKEEILEYLEICWQQFKEQVASMDLDAPSGFGWLPPDKLEQQIYNIRHLQQHTGELCERLGAKSKVEVGWILKSE